MHLYSQANRKRLKPDKGIGPPAPVEQASKQLASRHPSRDLRYRHRQTPAGTRLYYDLGQILKRYSHPTDSRKNR